MKHTLQYIRQIYPLNDQAIEQFKQRVVLKEKRKGEILFSPNHRHQFLYFIEKGLVRAYSVKEEKELTFWFGLEGEAVFPYKTYSHNLLSYETVELLEDCLFCTIAMSDLQNLYAKNIDWANWGRKFAEQQMVAFEQKFIDYQYKSARERHESLLRSHPELFQRIQLQHLASYLGMSQVSLSRIRAGIQ